MKVLHYFGRVRRKKRLGKLELVFAIRSSLVSQLEELPVGINERIMTMRLSLKKGRWATILSIYAPTMSCTDDAKFTFYSLLREVLRSIPKEDKIVLMGDFNAHVGTDNDTLNCLGKFRVGKMNSNGLLLLELCEEFDLSISSTCFKHKDNHITTWMHQR